ncbi:MAG: TRAP transporter substrate-binding protein [Cytophagales bacterium]|nr:TRAP transporter substrate-binding protein [Cytophagales bacterium]
MKRLSLIVLFLGITLLSQCRSEAEPEILLRASLLYNEDHTWYKAFIYFGELLEERSGGRMKLEVYPSEQLAKEMESIRLIQAEVIEMTIAGSLLSNWIEIATFCELPFLLQSYEEQEALINGPIGERIEKEMLEKTGLRPITYFVRGPRQLTSNRPIRHPDDLKGLILRVPNVSSFVTAWGAMGAKPTPMAFSEVFTSLQQGTIEALENPYSLILSAGFPEVQKYVNVTEHVMSWGYPIIGEKQFQKMPEDLKIIFLEAAEDMKTYEHKLFLESEAKVKAELRKKGMEFIEVDKEAFAKKCEKAIYESLSDDMKKVYQQIIDSKSSI